MKRRHVSISIVGIITIVGIGVLNSSAHTQVPTPVTNTVIMPPASSINLTKYKSKNVYPSSTITNTTHVASESYIVIDKNSESVLAEHDMNAQISIASLAKIVTILTVLNTEKLSDTITIRHSYENIPPQKIGLQIGEQYALYDIVAAAIINSSNDAAQALADSISDGNDAVFAKAMNETAIKLGMNHSHFSNAIGLDNTDQYATPYDITLAFQELLKHSEISELMHKKEHSISPLNNPQKKLISHTTNQLITNGIYGKTGTTPAAGGCFVGLATIHEHPVIIGVFGSPNRFIDTQALVDSITDSIRW